MLIRMKWKIIDSKLHTLTISCDGATQDVYEKYRRGGNLDLVFENLTRISAEKKRRKSVFPWIIAKYAIFDHNWHQCILFKEKSLAAGADEVLVFQAFMGGLYKTGQVGSGKIFDLEQLKWIKSEVAMCYSIWDKCIIDHDGSIYPCCICYRDTDLFVTSENTQNMTLPEQWNVEKFRNMRNFFLGKSSLELGELPRPCNTCKVSSAFKKNQQKKTNRQ